MNINKIVLLSLLWFLWSFSCFAGTYYCNNSTSSTNWAAAQNIGTPCTPATAMINASAGDITYFLDGTYEVAWSGSWSYPTLYPSNNGTSVNPITFKAQNALLAIMEGQAGTGNIYATQTIGAYLTNWCVWDGFKLTSVAGGFGRSKFNGADNCTIQNCEFVGQTVCVGVDNVDAIRMDNCEYLTIKNNYFHDYVETGADGHNLSGTKSYGLKHSILEQNTFENCQGGSAIYEKQGGYYNIYRFNFIKNSRRGFLIQSNTKNNEYHKIYQNIFIDINGNAIYKPSGDSHPANGMEVYNNVMYGTKGISYGGAGDWSFWNNIFSNNTDNYTLYGTKSNGDPEYSNYNLFYVGQSFMVHRYDALEAIYTSLATWQVSGELKGSGNPDVLSAYGNPNFASANGTDAEDYKLQAGSPALTLGVDRQDYDSDGNTTETIPAGAYITGNELIGYNATAENGSGGSSSSGSILSGITASGITFK